MLEHMKKPPIELKFIGPSENRDKAIDALRPFGFSDVSDYISADDLFDFEQTPGISLLGARTKENVTQKELSKLTGIPQRHISEIENNKRAIGIKRAKLLGATLNIDYKIFL